MLALGMDRTDVRPAQGWVSISRSLEAFGLWGLQRCLCCWAHLVRVQWPWVPW